VLEEEPRGHWHAYAPAVPGCFAGGRTRRQALQRYRSALKLHLETLDEHGDASPVEQRSPIAQISL
jgi:predicted RNase H-like HicB family nuclease